GPSAVRGVGIDACQEYGIPVLAVEVKGHLEILSLDLYPGIVGLEKAVHWNHATLVLPTMAIDKMIEQFFGPGVQAPKGPGIGEVFFIIRLVFLRGHDAP